MSDAVCPYCRAPITLEAGEHCFCNGCGTPHHSDCYEENGGCTVFGCRCAPADEPKLQVSGQEIGAGAAAAVAVAMAPPAVNSAPPPPPGLENDPRYATTSAPQLVAPVYNIASAITDVPPPLPKSKQTYVLLGALLGAFGAHNFYAGYKGRAIGQCAITLLTLGFGSPFSWIWAVVEICTIQCDSTGLEFST